MTAGPLQARFSRINASAIAVAITGLAFFLRVYRLDDQNIWWDEGWTIWLSRHDLAWIALRTASDEHPPLHYWLMHYWQMAAGSEAFAGRFFSVFFGLLTVALLYRLGRRIGGRPLGLLAAVLFTLARFQVWWSQDIKNYTLSGFFALASAWFALEIAELYVTAKSQVEEKTKPSNLQTFELGLFPWIGYVLAITAALYSHYLAALIFLTNNLFVFVVLLREWRAARMGKGASAAGPWQFLRRWVVAQLAVLLLFVPWLALYLQNAATWPAAPAFDVQLFLRLTATVFALGITTYIENYTWVVLGFAFIAALGLGWLRVRPFRTRLPSTMAGGTILALSIVLVPPVLIYLLSLTPAAFFAPKIQARYLLILLPGYTLLLSLGILFLARLNRSLSMLVLLLVAIAQVLALTDYFQGRVLRDDYATLANVVNMFALPGDGVVLETDQEWPTFLYYLHQPLAWTGVPNGTKVDASTAHRVAAQASEYRAVWLVTIPDALPQDPQRLVEAELAARWTKQYEQTFGAKRLTLYTHSLQNVKDVPPGNFAPQFARSDEFDSRLRLIGFDLPVREAQPGDSVRLVTYWQSLDLADVRLTLQNRDGTTIAGGTIPISIGGHERAQADLVIPPGTPTGELSVVAQARLGRRSIAAIAVHPRPAGPTSAAATTALDYGFGDKIRLVGLDLPSLELRAGQSLPLTLFWKTEQPLATSYTVFVHLLGAQYNAAQDNFLWGQVDRLPRAGELPTTAWPAGMTIDDAYSLPIRADAPPGLYKIEVGLYDAASGTRLPAFDANGKESADAVIVGQVEIK